MYSNTPHDRIHLHQSEAAVFAENSHHTAGNVLILANVRSRQTPKSLTPTRHEIGIYQFVNYGGLEEVTVCIKTMVTSHFKIPRPPISVRPVRSCLRPCFSSVLVYTAVVYSALFYIHRFLSASPLDCRHLTLYRYPSSALLFLCAIVTHQLRILLLHVFLNCASSSRLSDFWVID